MTGFIDFVYLVDVFDLTDLAVLIDLSWFIFIELLTDAVDLVFIDLRGCHVLDPRGMSQNHSFWP